MADVHGSWDPLSPPAVATLFAEFPPRWWLAGGYAIELAVGRRIRAHADIDALVLRPDLLSVPAVLPGWQLWAADPPGSLRRWTGRDPLPAHVHDVWCRPAPSGPWRLQIMVDETEGDHWVSRRDRRVRRPLSTLGRRTPDGLPYLAPGVQLFYKATNPRPKDEQDFRAVVPHLDRVERAWLLAALDLTFPAHPWRHRLADRR
ncbi:nucleotidyltransferase domain-containing protein [Goodfellowiella coeruleoviolacea]|uniref:Amino acid transporter n=1 Tax=Goodfellowiella coeruleoviolacea TaxID=334858 RepID=A0AAE3GBT5_9PSEU|nr:amino acid transporter [Goodfellowiella coeruleoviolacea]MCP2165401.1 hypothetical protein [Goodfellowiella coeruleoviolacea]